MQLRSYSDPQRIEHCLFCYNSASCPQCLLTPPQYSQGYCLPRMRPCPMAMGWGRAKLSRSLIWKLLAGVGAKGALSSLPQRISASGHELKCWPSRLHCHQLAVVSRCHLMTSDLSYGSVTCCDSLTMANRWPSVQRKQPVACVQHIIYRKSICQFSGVQARPLSWLTTRRLLLDTADAKIISGYRRSEGQSESHQRRACGLCGQSHVSGLLSVQAPCSHIPACTGGHNIACKSLLTDSGYRQLSV